MPRRGVIRGRRWAATFLTFVLIGWARLGRAQSPKLLAQYSADASCPDLDGFSELVRQRLRAAGSDIATLAMPQIEIDLREAGPDFRGRLALRRADASRYEREVSGASCSEVANALAFVLALALVADEGPPESPLPSGVAAAAQPPPREVPTVSPPAARRDGRPPSPRPAAARRQSALSLAAGVQLGTRTGLAPRWLVLEAAFFEVRRTTNKVWGPTLRGGFVNAASVSRSSLGGTTDFGWWSGRLEACPLRVRLLAPLELVPCAGMHLGRLRVSGHPVTEPAGSGRTSAQWWVEGLGTLRVEFAAARWLSVQAQAELLVPFTQYRFAFDAPDTPVYQVPSLAAGGFVGLAARFP